MLALAGFMGAGKTTVGRVIGRQLGWHFVDLDSEVEARTGKPVAQIFEEQGEAGFRGLENGALREVLAAADRPTVIALGGGTFVRSDNAEALKTAGVLVVFLDASVSVLRERCGLSAGARPLSRDENQFCQLYEARRPSYMQADLRVDTDGRSPDAVAAEIVTRLGLS